MKERRTKQQIYSDILHSICNSTDDDLKLTSIQLSSKLAYDKVKEYISYLEKCKLVDSKFGFKITNKGRLFLEKSESIYNNMEILDKKFLSEKLDLIESTDDYYLNAKTYLHKNPDMTTVSHQTHLLKEFIQIQNAMNATIVELESKK